MKFQDKLLELVKNEQLLKNIRTGAVLLLAILLPLGYFAYAESLTWESIFNIEFGALVIIVWATLQLVTKETKTRARDDRYLSKEEEKNEFVDLEKEIEQNKKDIIAKDKSLKQTTRWVSQYNKEQQDLYNEILTNDTIYKLEQRARDFRLDGKLKKANALEKDIERLKFNPLVDRTFEKYDVKIIANYNTSKFKRKKNKGNSEINVDPTKMNKKMSVATLLLRSAGIGIFGAIPIVFSESIGTILSFYLIYSITLVFTVITNYLLTTWIMDKVYKPALKRIVDIQELLLENLAKVEVIEEEQEEETKQEDFIYPKEDPFTIKKEA